MDRTRNRQQPGVGNDLCIAACIVLLAAGPAVVRAQTAIGEGAIPADQTAAADSTVVPAVVGDAVADSVAVPVVVGDAVADSVEVAEVARSAVLSEIDLWDTGVNPTLAVVMTPFFPGWGQLYARNSWRGALAFGVEWFYWSNLISRGAEARRIEDFAATLEPGSEQDFFLAAADETWAQMKDFAWWSGAILLIIALDAYVGAHLFDFDHDVIPVPNRWDEFDSPPAPPVATGDPLSLVLFQWRKSF